MKQIGFTLIELMIVVAVIGILSAFAIPQYNYFQEKARGQEARLALAHWSSVLETTFVDDGQFLENNTMVGQTVSTIYADSTLASGELLNKARNLAQLLDISDNTAQRTYPSWKKCKASNYFSYYAQVTGTPSGNLSPLSRHAVVFYAERCAQDLSCGKGMGKPPQGPVTESHECARLHLYREYAEDNLIVYEYRYPTGPMNYW